MKNLHGFHLVAASGWPLCISLCVLNLTLSTTMFFNNLVDGLFYLILNLVWTIIISSLWWRDIIIESTYLSVHTIRVLQGLRIGFLLFILSEIMFFFGFFWAYLHNALVPSIALGCVWPPFGLEIIGLVVPTANTLILLSSGAAITYAHICILTNNLRETLKGLGLTLGLALLFTLIQLYEYANAPFSISDGIFPSVFYLLTGFHGLHVIIGTVFIAVQTIRVLKGHATTKYHLGFEAAAWYWHFVDVVWLLVFLLVYVLPQLS